MMRSPLVSVIIPCYNQRLFLGEAIESALKQSYINLEIIVVDDGSTDDSFQVAARYQGVRLIRQANGGLSAARNAGIKASAGACLVFLDADDRLLPRAVQAGVDCMSEHPDSAFVHGHYTLISADGAGMPGAQRANAGSEPFLDLLRFNYIGMHATVMYRRDVLELFGGFDTSLDACEDYDLYLRISRVLPVRCHGRVVAEYRQHGQNMSANFGLMLRAALSVLDSQWKYIGSDERAQSACKSGIRNWQHYYGERLLKSARACALKREWGPAVSGALTLLRYYPRGVATKAKNKITRILARAPKLFSIKLSR